MDDFLTEVQCEEIYTADHYYSELSLEEIFRDFEEPA